MFDYYEILGVASDATQEEIRKAYRARAMRWHPDKWAAEPEVDREAARAHFEHVQEAYEHLRDAEKRSAFDRVRADLKPGSVGARPPGGAHPPSPTGSYAAEVARELKEALENAATATTPNRRRYWMNKAESWERTLDPIISMITNPGPSESMGATKKDGARKDRHSRNRGLRRTAIMSLILIAAAIVWAVILRR